MPNLAIKASGMVTSVGFNSPATCAAIRAGISGCKREILWDAVGGEHIQVGKVDTPHWWESPLMLPELAAPAIEECYAAIAPGVDRMKVPIYILLPAAERVYREDNLESIFRQELEYKIHSGSLQGYVGGIFSGRASVLNALVEIEKVFSESNTRYAVMMGVDSFLRRGVVNDFVLKSRILTDQNSNGFIPGEAACAVLVGPYQDDVPGELRIRGWGKGPELGTIDSEVPVTGDGLTQAVREALEGAGLSMSETDYWLTDQNAEHYKVKECTIVQIRLERRDQPAVVPYQIWHPIEFLGEIGSAVGPCLLGLAWWASKKRYAPGPNALMHVGEDNGDRVAFVLQWVGRS